MNVPRRGTTVGNDITTAVLSVAIFLTVYSLLPALGQWALHTIGALHP